MEKNIIKKVKEEMSKLSHEQVGLLLNIHSLYVSNLSKKVWYNGQKTFENFVFKRIKTTTDEKDYPTVLQIIEMLQNNQSYRDIMIFCENSNYTCLYA